MIAYPKQSLFKTPETGCNWEYDPISRQLTIRTDEGVSMYDEDAMQLLKDHLPPAETGRYRIVLADDETQFSEEIYDERSSSLYIFLSSFWRKKEEGQEIRIHAV